MVCMENKERILMIVESPNKIKSLKQFLPSNYIVMASVGHITELNNSGLYNLGIDVKNDFKANFVVSQDKKEIVSKLKEQVKLADKVILASDPDREGEAISWHLKNQLKIADSKYQRITYHEITKSAILKALDNPRKIDEDLVIAAISRQKLDKIVGFRLSGIARKNVNAKSVGRCQSAGLKIIVQREEEIQNFKPETYFDLYLNFTKNNVDFRAKYIGTDKTVIDHLKTKDSCQSVIKDCSSSDYNIINIETKDLLDNPKPPFTTSTFQQEVSKKLGLSVNKAMSCAQKLFEGIDINGQHIALITYIRTDSAEYAPEFIPLLENYVKNTFGNNYYAPVRKAKKSENTQDGHEAIRPVDLSMTPEKLSSLITDELLLKVYTIIYKRTIASSMASAVIGNTDYIINNSNHRFKLTSKELKFDGYKKVYNYKEDDDKEEVVKEIFTIGEKLNNTELEIAEKQTKPPVRFSEASFIKELDKLGIGRPSTYATIVNVLLDEGRGYCSVQDKVIVPTDKGINLSHFLDKSFGDIINIGYTAEMEKDLDLIAKGKLNDIDFLRSFYTKLEDNIHKVEPIESETNEICPECGGKLITRKGPYGYFKGCSNYPKCKKKKKEVK